MTKKELLDLLEGVADDAEIVMAKDAEGNDFSPLSGVATGFYEPHSTWSGQHYPHPNEDPEWYADADALRAGKTGNPEVGWEYLAEREITQFAICLWPVN